MGFVNVKDSRGRYPIDVANELELGWDKGMKEIVDTFAYAQGINPVIMSAKYGLTWENSMKNVVGKSEIGIIQGKEEISGLYPFMLAGVGMKYDLGSIFKLIQRSPRTVQSYENCFNDDEKMTRRRSMRVQEMKRRNRREGNYNTGKPKKKFRQK